MKHRWLATLLMAGLCTTAHAQLAPSPSTAPSPTTAPTSRASIAADQTTPRGAVKVLETSLIKGDTKAVLGVILTTTPVEEKVTQSFALNNAAKMTLAHAVQAKFPPPGTDPTAMEAQQMNELMGRIDAMDEAIKGDDALVGMSAAGPQAQLPLKRVDGKWKIPFAAIFTGLTDMDQRVAELDLQTGVFSELASELLKGKYNSMQEFEQAGRQKMMQAMLANATSRPTGQAATTQPATTRP